MFHFFCQTVHSLAQTKKTAPLLIPSINHRLSSFAHLNEDMKKKRKYLQFFFQCQKGNKMHNSTTFFLDEVSEV